ncbi:hypothetical protein P0M11_08845 [Kaistella sp. PBT33-4]|uniref:hypothetical protein n=1 Tax=Kaistella sp. PBT33-4 TaxID=3032000 RepID=UPI0023D7D3AA|nr:hypothetical protein [Kaistella sp. PBT33-4]MDF0720105.1 hypothetical protein [Kaistella sp. PBT33-4]
MNKFVQFLEIIKYRTFSSEKLEHSNGSAEMWHYTNVQVKTPEGYSFLIKEMRINYFKPMGKNRNYIHIQWGNNGIMQSDQTGLTFNVDQDKVYVFHSNQFLELSPDEQIAEKAKFSATVSSGGFWGYIYSVIIQVHGNGSSIADFEGFMNMTQNIWQQHFDDAVSAASNTNNLDRNFEYILKYHPDILKKNLSYQDRVNLLEVLAYHELWDFLDEVDEQEFALLLLETVPPNEEYALYQHMFELNQQHNTILFKALEEKFDETGNLRFVLHLMKIKYNSVLTSGGTQALENYITTIPAHYTVPIRTIKKNLINLYGPDPEIILLNDKIHINKIDYYGGNPGIPIQFNPNEDPFSHLYNDFQYEEMLNVLIRYEQKDLGLPEGKILPIPAFALKGFSEGISEDVTWKDIIQKFVETLSIILPFYKLTYIIHEGVFLWSEVAGTSVSLGNAITSTYISSFLEQEIKNSDSVNGKRFLQAYNYVKFLYANKDLPKAIKDGNVLALLDGENLMTLWDDYYTINQAVYDSINTIESRNLKQELDEIKKEINLKK